MERYYQPEIECASREQIRAWQDERLVKQVRHAYDHVPYYKKLMDEKGVRPEDIKSVDDLHKLPFTYKKDLRDTYPYGLFAVPMKDVVRLHASSGTTGKQIVVGYTREDLDIWDDIVARQLVAVGATEEDKVHISYGYGLFTGGLGLHGGATKLGATVIPVSSGNTQRQITILRDFGSTVLCCTPSYAAFIGETLHEMGLTGKDIPLKAGIFGALIITADLLPGEHRWGVLLLALGAVTMVLGAAIAVFSNNLKYILACSSLSQIGFILVGTAALALLGQHNALAAHGTVLYMMNHSLVKLTLFLLAGVVYCNTHALDLNQIRGFGRGKPLLHILFLCGACSLAGIPGFLGYISKTLVHESLVELAAESGSLGVTAVEWLFLFSGGLTAAYLTKIYAALFWQKPAASTGRTWGTPATTAALILAALPLPVLGLLPHVLAEPVAALALPFVGGHPFGHAVHYLAWENLKGVAISLTIGMAVYFLFIRLVLMDRREGQVVYLERWPRWLSLEDRVYRPAIRGLYRVLNVVMRAVCDALDFLVLVARRTFLRDSRPRRRKSPRSAVLHAMTHGGQRTEQEAADRLGTILDTIRRMEGSLSYALLMACLGLCVVLVCILLYVF